MSRDVGTRRYRNPGKHFLRSAMRNPAVNQSCDQFLNTKHSTSTHRGILKNSNLRPETTTTGPANPFLPKMPSLRSILGASTSALRQSILSRPQPFFARSFSQLSRLSLTSGLRGLRSRLQQSQNAGNGTVPAGAAAAGVRQLEQVRGMKTRSSVKRLCDGCKVCFLAVVLSWTVVYTGFHCSMGGLYLRTVGACFLLVLLTTISTACPKKEPGVHYLVSSEFPVQ